MKWGQNIFTQDDEYRRLVNNRRRRNNQYDQRSRYPPNNQRGRYNNQNDRYNNQQSRYNRQNGRYNQNDRYNNRNNDDDNLNSPKSYQNGRYSGKTAKNGRYGSPRRPGKYGGASPRRGKYNTGAQHKETKNILQRLEDKKYERLTLESAYAEAVTNLEASKRPGFLERLFGTAASVLTLGNSLSRIRTISTTGADVHKNARKKRAETEKALTTMKSAFAKDLDQIYNKNLKKARRYTKSQLISKMKKINHQTSINTLNNASSLPAIDKALSNSAIMATGIASLYAHTSDSSKLSFLLGEDPDAI